MGKLLWIIFVSSFFQKGDCRPIGKHHYHSEIMSDDHETCPKGISYRSDFLVDLIYVGFDITFSRRGRKNYIAFQFFSHKNQQEPNYVTNDNFTLWSIDGHDFNPSIKTIFIIHGFKDRYSPWKRKMKDALFFREHCNVFIVEYGYPSDTWEDVLQNIPEVGKQVAVFIRNLVKTTTLDLAKIHIIGHSAGAQSAGFAGKEIKRTENKSLGRITGLEPAGPGFYSATPERRLDATDALFVDIIHTDIGCNRLEGFGQPDALGHFDFYPNGGYLQPGCLSLIQLIGQLDFHLTKLGWKYLFGSPSEDEKHTIAHVLCSHFRAYDFFTASILNEGCKFESVQCSGWNHYLSGQCYGNEKVVMGYYADRYKHLAEAGIHKKFYLKTSANSPYCL